VIPEGAAHKFPAITYSRPRRTTIGPGCLTAVFGMGTGGTIRVCSPRNRVGQPSARRRDRSVSPTRTSVGETLLSRPYRPGVRYIKKAAAELHPMTPCISTRERGINAAKRSAVSTGQLSVLPHVHLRPIDPVVFREPSPKRAGDLVLRGVSRLDAFSVYPGRT
jgi:hypothetical protein